MVFSIYKRGQGKYTRLCTAFGLGIIIGLGCLQLYKQLKVADWGVDTKTMLWIATMIPAALFISLCIVLFWLVNKPSIADFMIAAEGEMKKVNWSSRKEIAVSTFIVIVVVVFLASLIGVTDISFKMLFDWFL